MSTTAPTPAPGIGADDEVIRPFTINVPQESIDELRRRLVATNWPEKETVAETEQAYPNLIYFNELDRSNHFAAWQEPDLFTTEVRAGFRSLRTTN